MAASRKPVGTRKLETKSGSRSRTRIDSLAKAETLQSSVVDLVDGDKAHALGCVDFARSLVTRPAWHLVRNHNVIAPKGSISQSTGRAKNSDHGSATGSCQMHWAGVS